MCVRTPFYLPPELNGPNLSKNTNVHANALVKFKNILLFTLDRKVRSNPTENTDSSRNAQEAILRKRFYRNEKDFIADLKEAKELRKSKETEPIDASSNAKNDPSAGFDGANVRKQFIDVGLVVGVIIRHVSPSSKAGQPKLLRYDNDDTTIDSIDGGMFGERFVVEYSNDKKEAVRPK